MNKIAMSIMVVGLCFYNAYLQHHGIEFDHTAGLIAFIGSLIVLFG